MIASVIVDIQAKQTDRAFDYLVPESMREWIEIGSRVAVPFGPRLIQGFVIGFPAASELDVSRLRPIEQLLDIQPPLNEELVRLGRWMSQRYLCREITALTAMVPAALKAKYDRVLAVSQDAAGERLSDLGELERSIIDILRAKGAMSRESLLQQVPKAERAIKRLVSLGLIMERQLVKDQSQGKKLLTVCPAASPQELTEALQTISARAPRQQEIIRFLIEHPQPIALSELSAVLQADTTSAVKSLVAKGLVTLRSETVMRDPYKYRSFERTSPLPLTDAQSKVFAEIRDALDTGEPHAFLLQGVTGSGKTEIYLQAIERTLAAGKEAIVLVPEISLTPQMVERFKGRFGDLVAVMHSRLSQGERYDEWRKVQLTQAKVVVGARSAVFAPFRHIGIIIIDEEHETSYKQEESPKYHARDIALWRIQQHGATLVLGSATPSLETYKAAVEPEEEDPRIRRLALEERVAGRPLPPVKLVDMREELHTGNRSMFSRQLREAIEDRLQRGEQMILLLNRRGYSTFVMCRSCGTVCECPHCDISLTYHRSSRTLRCHYCGYAEREPDECPTCASPHIRFFGTGTQRVEEELVRLYPGIRVIRMDVDTTSEKGSHEKWLKQFQERRADVLLGTQMVAKGLDFPYVTLVGVIAADSVLRIPDFRSAERTFQLLTQVAGRAGRHDLPGEVIVQTYAPDHYSIVSASQHDYGAFVRRELEERRMLDYPPYSRLILITLSHLQLASVMRAGEQLAQAIRRMWEARRQPVGAAGASDQMLVLGPVASPIPRIKDRYRFQCMVKYRGNVPAPELVHAASEEIRRSSDPELQLVIDVDPYMMM
jgi:primosomal protein N' (replication factor Y)